MGQRDEVAKDSGTSAALRNGTALGGLNVGGFSDAVFSVVSAFLSGDAGRFVAEVEAVER